MNFDPKKREWKCWLLTLKGIIGAGVLLGVTIYYYYFVSMYMNKKGSLVFSVLSHSSSLMQVFSC